MPASEQTQTVLGRLRSRRPQGAQLVTKTILGAFLAELMAAFRTEVSPRATHASAR